MSAHALKFDFMGWRKLALVLSLLLVTGSIGSLVVRQLNLGLDFTGGALIEVAYDESVSLEPIRKTLEQIGFGDSVVQHFGSSSEVLVRVPPVKGEDKAKVGDTVFSALKDQAGGAVKLSRIEFVGPQVGDELRDKSGVAMLVALFFMLIYVGLRFRLKFAVGAVVALFHDVLITLGFFSLLQVPFDLTVLAAVLAVIGYSLNDTIVVSDRIRENFRKIRTGGPVEIINMSLNQTLSRTLITSLTTMLVLLALFFFGGEMIHSFSIALIVGVIVGTYSSIYVASNVLLALDIKREDFLEPEPEEEFEQMP